jgi:hypothetical protein
VTILVGLVINRSRLTNFDEIIGTHLETTRVKYLNSGVWSVNTVHFITKW